MKEREQKLFNYVVSPSRTILATKIKEGKGTTFVTYNVR